MKRTENLPEPVNLFSHPATILSFLGTIVVSGNMVIKDIAKEGLNVENGLDLVNVILVQLGVTGTVYTGDKNTYTPNGLIGRNKEETPGVTFVDLNDNGVKDKGEPEIPDSIDDYLT